MRNILVATDLSERNKYVLSKAITLAKTTKATLHILHVTYNLSSPPSKKLDADEHEKAKKYIENTFEKISHHHLHVIKGGRIYDRVLEYAQKLHVDLTVIGKPNRNLCTPPIIQTTTERICLESRNLVLVALNQKHHTYNQAFAYIDRVSSICDWFIIIPQLYKGMKVTFLKKRVKRTQSFLARVQKKYNICQLSKYKSLARKFVSIEETKITYQSLPNITCDTLVKKTRLADNCILAFNPRKKRNGIEPILFTRELIERSPCDLLMVGGL